MKKILASLATLAIAASSQAHVTGAPHVHNESPLSWATVLTILAAVVVSVLAFRSYRNLNKR